MALDLTIRQKIAKSQGELVKCAEELVETCKLWEIRKLKTTQLRNVANIAASSECVEVVTNFIKYQSGRHGEWNDNNFAEEAIKKIENNVKKTAEGIINKQTDIDEVWIELCRAFWGYLIRYVTYKKKDGGQE